MEITSPGKIKTDDDAIQFVFDTLSVKYNSIDNISSQTRKIILSYVSLGMSGEYSLRMENLDILYRAIQPYTHDISFQKREEMEKILSVE